jgi:hypothetical protein
LLLVACGAALAALVPGDRIAPFALPAASGGVCSWQPGEVTVLSFCALWCDTWKEQRLRVDAVAAATRGLPVTFLTVSIDGRWPERWPRGASGSHRVLLDTGRVSGALGIRRVPYTVVTDARGNDRRVVAGLQLRYNAWETDWRR